MPNVHTDEETYDAIVVGSGITGGWAAKELCENGLDVLLLERGRYVEHGTDYVGEHKPAWDMPYRGWGDRDLYEEEYEHQHHCYAFGEGTRHFFVNDAKHQYDTPDQGEDGHFRWLRGYQLGGRSIMWGRLCWRWSDLDFEANKKSGHGVDWPIRYDDIDPWYTYVEKHVGISGSKENLPQVPDGAFLPPMDMNCAERKVSDGIARAGFDDGRRLIIGRAAVLTEQHKGRAPCHYCGPCHRGCSTGSYFSSLSSTLPAAQAAEGDLTIACDSIVSEVLYDRDAGDGEKGRATGVRVVDRLTKERREHEADLVFLCASTLGSTQILLNSTSRRFPEGLGNDSGALGHYLMDHPIGGGATATVPGLEDKFYYGHRPNVVYIPRFRNLDGPRSDDLGFERGYGLQGAASREPWSRGANEAGIGQSLKEKLRRPGPWKISIGGNGEMLPRRENRVALKDETDEWGLPLIDVYCEFGENEARMREDAKTQAAETLDAAGCRDIETYMRDHPAGHNIHEMGTARMGRDPDTSVLNGWNQIHSVPNVFVTDGSCMASSACQNPSITYMALTARAADYAVKQLKKREL